jgi:AmmeMemoRadiSam system protein B
MGVRKADFAGSWYPGGEWECREVIDDFSKACVPCPSGVEGIKGGIVPHAGWYYSGQIAFNVMKCLKNEIDPDIIAIFGRHLHPGSGNYIMSEGAWSTPLGDLEIAGDIADKLISEFKFTIETPSRYEQDNTIELQLPFIKFLFPEVKILPIGAPPVPASLRVGEAAARIVKDMGKKMLVLGSTDLTHYGYNYGLIPMGVGREAVDWVKQENDKRMIDLMLDMDAEGVISESLTNSNACCSGAVAAAISAVKGMGARKGEKLIYTTSYDISPSDSFVGYAGIIYY